MTLPARGPDRARIRQIRREAGLDDAEALARLFEDEALGGNGSLEGRLRAILRATEKRPIKGLQTGLPFLDAGFRGDQSRGGAGFRDPWPSSRNQVGHFLTAAGLAFRPAAVSDPVLGIPLRTWIGADAGLTDERVALRLTIGHELASDPGVVLGAIVGGIVGGAAAPLLGARGRAAALGAALGLAGGAFAGALAQQLLGFRRQFARAADAHEQAFARALDALGAGPRLDLAAAERELGPIIRQIDIDSRGNSLQDLRLSLLGWYLGRAVRTGAWARGADAASWIRAHLKAP